jgi:hypothetical protein
MLRGFLAVQILDFCVIGKIVRRRDKTAKLYGTGKMLRGVISVPVMLLLRNGRVFSVLQYRRFSLTLMCHGEYET